MKRRIVARLETLLDQFLGDGGEKLSADPLKRVLLQRDLWTLFDFLTTRHIDRRGDAETRSSATRLWQAGAAIQALALPAEALAKLPDNYALAVQSGRFAATHEFDPRRDYLPPRILSGDDEWQELDFYQAHRSEDVERRYVFLHMRAFQGRSYFRVFCRFPNGRPQLEEYLQAVGRPMGSTGAPRRSTAAFRSGPTRCSCPRAPKSLLLQFLIALDANLQLVPTPLVESVRLLVFKNATGTPDPETNMGNGVNAIKYTLKRRLALADSGMQHGGLHREPDDLPVYRVLFENEAAPDWGSRGRYTKLVADCRACHSAAARTGVQTIGSMVNTASIDSGAALGVSHTLPAAPESASGTNREVEDRG